MAFTVGNMFSVCIFDTSYCFHCIGSSLATSAWMYVGFASVSPWWHLVYAKCRTARA